MWIILFSRCGCGWKVGWTFMALEAFEAKMRVQSNDLLISTPIEAANKQQPTTIIAQELPNGTRGTTSKTLHCMVKVHLKNN